MKKDNKGKSQCVDPSRIFQNRQPGYQKKKEEENETFGQQNGIGQKQIEQEKSHREEKPQQGCNLPCSGNEEVVSSFHH